MFKTYTAKICESGDHVKLSTSVINAGNSNSKCLNPFFSQNMTLLIFLPYLLI
jgi:hypothetical protein